MKRKREEEEENNQNNPRKKVKASELVGALSNLKLDPESMETEMEAKKGFNIADKVLKIDLKVPAQAYVLYCGSMAPYKTVSVANVDQLTHEEFIKFITLLNPAIEELELTGGNLDNVADDVFAKNIQTFFQSHTTLRSLSFKNVLLSESKITSLAQTLEKHPILTQLTLSSICNSRPSSYVTSALTSMLRSNISITGLDISYNKLSNECLRMVRSSLLLHTMQTLNLLQEIPLSTQIEAICSKGMNNEERDHEIHALIDETCKNSERGGGRYW